MTARFSFVEHAEQCSGDTEDGGSKGSHLSGSPSKDLQLSNSGLGLGRSSADGSTCSGSEGRSTARWSAGMPPHARAVHPHRESGVSPYFWSLLRCVAVCSCGHSITMTDCRLDA